MAEKDTPAIEQLLPVDRDATALVPLVQRQVLIEGEEVLALWTGQQDICIPLRPLCDGLGGQLNGQPARIGHNEVMAEGLRQIRAETEGGPQIMQPFAEQSIACLRRDRRLTRDYEYTTSSSEARVLIAAIGRSLHRLAPGAATRVAPI